MWPNIHFLKLGISLHTEDMKNKTTTEKFSNLQQTKINSASNARKFEVFLAELLCVAGFLAALVLRHRIHTLPWACSHIMYHEQMLPETAKAHIWSYYMLLIVVFLIHIQSSFSIEAWCFHYRTQKLLIFSYHCSSACEYPISIISGLYWIRMLDLKTDAWVENLSFIKYILMNVALGLEWNIWQLLQSP